MMVATEIANQLRGALYMIGAKNLVASDNALLFKIMRNCKNVTNIKIELNGLDLYNVTYYNVRGTAIKTLATSTNIYNDMLKADIRRNTGLRTIL